jgi:hypothetical protein
MAQHWADRHEGVQMPTALQKEVEISAEERKCVLDRKRTSASSRKRKSRADVQAEEQRAAWAARTAEEAARQELANSGRGMRNRDAASSTATAHRNQCSMHGV